MPALLSPVFIVAWMVANSIRVSMLFEGWISLVDGCVGHRLIRASTVATGLQEMATSPLAMLDGEGISETFLLKFKKVWIVYFC